MVPAHERHCCLFDQAHRENAAQITDCCVFHVSLDSPVMVVYSAVPEGLLIYSDLREHIKNNILYTGQSQDGTLWDNGGVITVVLMFRRR